MSDEIKGFSIKGIDKVNELLARNDSSQVIDWLIEEKNNIRGLVVTVVFQDGDIETLKSGLSILQSIGALEAGKYQLLNDDNEDFDQNQDVKA